MPSLFEIQTVTRQFFRVETELSVLKAMVRDLLTPPVDPSQIAANAPLTVEQPATESPEPRQAQHFDGRRWVPGPSPETNVGGLDVPTGQG